MLANRIHNINYYIKEQLYRIYFSIKFPKTVYIVSFYISIYFRKFARIYINKNLIFTNC